MADQREPVPGSYTDRENQRNERAAMNRRILGVRRAMMGTGLALAGLLAASAGISAINQPSSNGEHSPTPAATEKFEPEQFTEKLLQKDPEALVFSGGQIEINLGKTDKGYLLPRIRSDASTPEENRGTNTFLPTEIKLINGAPYNPDTSNTFIIENYTAVKGENMDDSTIGAPKQNWLALEITKTDGSEVLAFMSLSNQTSEYYDVQKSVVPTMLRSVTGTQAEDMVNHTTTPSKP